MPLPSILSKTDPGLCQGRGGAWDHRRCGTWLSSNASKPFRRPPRQQLLQLHAPAICFQGVQDCRLPGLKPPKPFRRPSRQQLLQLHAPAICFSGGSRQVCLASNPPNSSAGFQGNNSYSYTVATTCPCHLFFRGFKTAVCPASNPPNPSNPQAFFQGVQDCRLPGLKRSKPFRRPPRQQLLQLQAPAICFSGGSRLPFARPQTLQTLPTSRRPPRQQLLQLHAPAICFSGGSRLPFARPQTPQTLPHASKATTLTATYMPLPSVFQGVQARPHTLQTFPQASKASTLTATCPCHLFFRGFKTVVCPASNAPNPSAGLQGNNSYQLHAPAICFSGGSRLPFARPQTPQTLPQASKATTLILQLLHAPAICFSGGSRLPFARPQTPQTLPTLPQASKATTLTATCPCHLFFRGFKTAVCPASNPPNPSAGLQGNNSYSYMPLPSVFQGVQDCRLPALQPPKPSRRPFSGGSRLPFARPQTPQTLPQASKATTLTATCPCHLFFRGFKTAVCPASNAPNPPAGLQGNKLLQLHAPAIDFIFQGVQDCRLPGLKPSKRFRRLPRQQLLQLHTCPCHLFFRGFKPALTPSERFRRLPRQQLLQLHVPAICFSGGSRTPVCLGLKLPKRFQPSRRPPRQQLLLTATTCPCHLFFRGFKTAVCPASNPPNASNPPAGLQGNNSYLTATTCPCHLFFRGFKTAVCRPQTPQTLPTLPQASKATTLTATCPCHLFFRGFKTAVCLASNPPNASAGFQGNNSYSYIHAPAICFSGGFKPALTPSERFAGFQGNNSYSYMSLPSVFSGGSRLPFARPQTPKRFQPSR